MGFPGSSDGKLSACNAGDPGLIPGFGRSPGEGTGNPLQYSSLENPMDRGAWQARVNGITRSQTHLSSTLKKGRDILGGPLVKTASTARGAGSIPGSGRSPGEGTGNPFQYSCLENPMAGQAWQATVHGVAKFRIERLHVHFLFIIYIVCLWLRW